MDESVLATFHTEEPVSLDDGAKLVVRQEGDDVVVRRVPEIDSDEPIHSFRELAEAHRANAACKLRGPQ